MSQVILRSAFVPAIFLIVTCLSVTREVSPRDLRTSRAASAAHIPLQCGGLDDTSELNLALAREGTVVIPKGQTCAAGNAASFAAATGLRIEKGGFLKVLNGQTVVISGQLEAGPYQIFANALQGQGTVSFAPTAPVATIYPEWWGPKGSDWSLAFQEASKNRQGRTIELQAATYQINSTVTFDTTQVSKGLPNGGFKLVGRGPLATVIDNQVANGPAFRLYGNLSNVPNPSLGFDFHTVLSDFKILTTTSPTNSGGIEISSNWYLRIERVWIEGLSGDAIRIDNNSGRLDDENSTMGFVIEHCTIRNNKGYGIRTRQSPVFVAIGLGEIKYSYIVGNGLAGILFSGSMVHIEGNSIAQNLAGGLYVPPDSPNVTLRIDGNEFESNVPFNLRMTRSAGGLIENNHFNASDIEPNNLLKTGADIILGDDVGGDNPTYYADRIALRQNRFRASIATGVRGNVGIDLRKNARWCTIEGSNWQGYNFSAIAGTVSTTAGSPILNGTGSEFLTQAPASSWIRVNGQLRRIAESQSNSKLLVQRSFDYTASGVMAFASPNLRVLDDGIGNQLRDEGEQVVQGWKWSSTTIAKTGSTTEINLLDGLFQRINFSAGGTQTLSMRRISIHNNPAPILVLELLNNADNTLSVVFDSSFVIRNFVTPTVGKATRCLFIFNPGQSYTWTQIGDWTTSEGLTRAGGTYAAAPTAAPEITRNENDFNPGGSSLYQRWQARSVRNITGLTFQIPQVDGQTHYLINAGSADIVLKNDDPGSRTENRFLMTTGTDMTLSPNQMALCFYDAASARWRCSKLN